MLHICFPTLISSGDVTQFKPIYSNIACMEDSAGKIGIGLYNQLQTWNQAILLLIELYSFWLKFQLLGHVLDPSDLFDPLYSRACCKVPYNQNNLEWSMYGFLSLFLSDDLPKLKGIYTHVAYMEDIGCEGCSWKQVNVWLWALSGFRSICLSVWPSIIFDSTKESQCSKGKY